MIDLFAITISRSSYHNHTWLIMISSEEYPGFQFSSLLASSTSATKRAEAPVLLSISSKGISFPVTCLAVSMTSLTENLFPELYTALTPLDYSVLIATKWATQRWQIRIQSLIHEP